MKITQFIALAAIAVSGVAFISGCDDRKSESTDMRRTDGSNSTNTPSANPLPPTEGARTASEQIPPTLDRGSNPPTNTTTLQPPLTPPDGIVVPNVPSTQPSTQPVGF